MIFVQKRSRETHKQFWEQCPFITQEESGLNNDRMAWNKGNDPGCSPADKELH